MGRDELFLPDLYECGRLVTQAVSAHYVQLRPPAEAGEGRGREDDMGIRMRQSRDRGAGNDV